MSEPNKPTRTRAPSLKAREMDELLSAKQSKMRRVEPAKCGPANSDGAISPVTGDVGQSLVPPDSPPSDAGSPGPGGGGAAEEVCNDELEKLRETLKVVQGSAFDLVDELNRVNHEFDAVKTELASVGEETLSQLQASHDDRVELRLHNNELQGSNDELQGSVDDNKSTILRLRAEIARLKAADLRRNTDSRLQTSTGLGKEPMQYPQSCNTSTKDANEASSSRSQGRGGASSASNGAGASSSRGKDVQGGASSSRALATEKPKEHDAAHINALLKRGVPIMMEIEVVGSYTGQKKFWPIEEGGKLFPPPLGVSLKKLELTIVSPMRPPEPGMVEAAEPCEAFKRKGKVIFRLPNREGMEAAPSAKLRCSDCGCHRGHHEQVPATSVLTTLQNAGSVPGDCSWLRKRIEELKAYESEDPQSSDEEAHMDLDGNSNGESGDDSDGEPDDKLDGNSNREFRVYSSDDSSDDSGC